jgi:hypothetical protein
MSQLLCILAFSNALIRSILSWSYRKGASQAVELYNDMRVQPFLIVQYHLLLQIV